MKLSSLVGMASLKARINIQIESCRVTGEPFAHSILSGVGGCGKTALARAVGFELDYHFVETHAALFKKVDTLYNILTRSFEAAKHSERRLFFFIDEIHRLKQVLQESLYSAMKEWWLPTPKGRYNISPFTLFGATTRLDMLDENSFVKRFENRWTIDRYSSEEIAIIVAQHLSDEGFSFSRDVSLLIAERCLGIPRTAVNLANKVRHMALANRSEVVTPDHVLRMFKLEGIDGLGLNLVHRHYLSILSFSRNGKKYMPLGIGAISAKMGQSEDLIRGTVEPILMEFNFISPTPRGRVITSSGIDYLNKVS